MKNLSLFCVKFFQFHLGTLRFHIKSVHENLKPFNCKICLKSFWDKGNLKCHIPGVLNLLVPANPQIKIVPLCVSPNQNCIPFVYPQIKKIYPNKFHLGKVFKFCISLQAPGVPPVASSRTPRGTRIPGGNRWSRLRHQIETMSKIDTLGPQDC